MSNEAENMPPEEDQLDVVITLVPHETPEIEVLVAGSKKRIHSMPASAAYTARIESLEEEERATCLLLVERIDTARPNTNAETKTANRRVYPRELW